MTTGLYGSRNHWIRIGFQHAYADASVAAQHVQGLENLTGWKVAEISADGIELATYEPWAIVAADARIRAVLEQRMSRRCAAQPLPF